MSAERNSRACAEAHESAKAAARARMRSGRLAMVWVMSSPVVVCGQASRDRATRRNSSSAACVPRTEGRLGQPLGARAQREPLAGQLDVVAFRARRLDAGDEQRVEPFAA